MLVYYSLHWGDVISVSNKFDSEVITDVMVRAAIESICKDYKGVDLFSYPGMDGPITAPPSPLVVLL
jgi:hypothetical protein